MLIEEPYSKLRSVDVKLYQDTIRTAEAVILSLKTHIVHHEAAAIEKAFVQWTLYMLEYNKK